MVTIMFKRKKRLTQVRELNELMTALPADRQEIVGTLSEPVCRALLCYVVSLVGDR